MGRWAGWWLLGLLALGAVACDQGSRVVSAPEPTPRPTPRTVRVTGEVGLEGRADAAGVQVYIPDSSFLSITGPQGRYTLRGVEPGEYAVMARADGFRTHLIANIAVPDPPTTPTVVLARAVLKLARPMMARRRRRAPPADRGRRGGRRGGTRRFPARPGCLPRRA